MSPSGGHGSQHRVTEHTKPLTCARKAGTRPLAPGAALPRPRSPAGRMGVAWRPPCRSGRSVHPQGPSPVPGGRDKALAGALRVDLCPLQKVFSVHVSHTRQIAPNPRAKPSPPSTRAPAHAPAHAHAHAHTRTHCAQGDGATGVASERGGSNRSRRGRGGPSAHAVSAPRFTFPPSSWCFRCRFTLI